MESQIAELKRFVKRVYGEPFIPFVDDEWVQRGRSFDLFREYSRRAGQSIGLTEAVAFSGGRPLPLYFVPERNYAPFVHFLSNFVLALDDGGLLTPQLLRPGQWMPPRRGSTDGLGRLCYAIVPSITPADHEDNARLRELYKCELQTGGAL